MMGVEVVFWYWWVFSVILLGIEILAPGFFFLWLSIAGAIVGGILLLFPSMTLESQLFIFSLFSIISIFVWRKYGKEHLTETDHPLLNKRGDQYIGRVFSLIEPIENGRGRIKADDTIWTVEGEDASLGTKVEVVSVEGVLFKVKIIS